MLLQMNVSAGILILMIVILRFLAIHYLPKRAFTLLWKIVLLRLLLPFHLPINYGIASPVTRAVGHSMRRFEDVNYTVSQNNVQNLTKTASSAISSSTDLLTVIWLAGALILLCFLGLLYLKEHRKLHTALPVSEEEADKLRSLAEIPGRVKLLVSDRVSTPLTFGIITPVIILPKLLDGKADLRYILTHELIHIRRADNLLKIAILITVSIHWFNPLVWVMYILFNRDIELSCDEKVLSLLGEHQRKNYALALVNLAEKQHSWLFFSNAFGKNAVQERIVAIMKFKKVTAVSIICTVILSGAALTVFAKNTSDIKVSNIDTEGMDSAGNSILAVTGSKYFQEYQKYGLSYDSAENHLMYDNKIVGYFKDETSKDHYIRITDISGSVGLVVQRDQNYVITGFDIVSIPEEAETYENAGIMDLSSSHTDAGTEEGDGDNRSILKDYESYGMFFDAEQDAWKYKGKLILGLTDTDNGIIYMNENKSRNSVYLQVNKGEVKEVSEEEFNRIINS